MVRIIEGTLSKESKRYEDWIDVFGTDTIVMESDQPVEASSPTGFHQFYKVDVSKLTTEQIDRCAEFISLVWNLPLDEVRFQITDPMHGIPMEVSDIQINIREVEDGAQGSDRVDGHDPASEQKEL